MAMTMGVISETKTPEKAPNNMAKAMIPASVFAGSQIASTQIPEKYDTMMYILYRPILSPRNPAIRRPNSEPVLKIDTRYCARDALIPSLRA